MTEYPMANDRGREPPGSGEEDADRLVHALAQLRLAEADISERAFLLETVINQIPDYIYAKDLDGRFLFANSITVADNGLEDLSQLIGRTDFDLHDHEAAASIARTERKVIESGEPDLGIEEESIGVRRNRWLMMSRVPLRDKQGRTIGVVGVSRDITARKAAERLMQAQARLLEMIAQGVALHVFLEELIHTIEERMSGLKVAAFMRSQDGAQLHLMAAPSLDENFCAALRAVPVGPKAATSGLAAWTGERVICSDLALLGPTAKADAARNAGFRSCWAIPILSFQGAAIGVITFYSPDTVQPQAQHDELIAVGTHLARIAIERRQAEERIRFLANHDTLTGLPNRVLMDDEIESAIRAAAISGRHVALAYLDLDNFKLVNDSLGHAAGDELLKIVAGRMADSNAGDGMVVRVGGDEFILLKTIDDASPAALNHLFETLRADIAEPICLQGLEFQVTCSMGIACYPQHGANATELLANADAAMYRAKGMGRDKLQIFAAEMTEKTRQKLARTEELRRALRHGEFELHYQPQVNQRTGEITGAEALLRWRHPVDGMVPPGEFIPLAEAAGLIVPLGDWVLREACRQARAWQDSGMAPIIISVNVSPRQFRETGWVEQVRTALENSGIDPRLLELEITEGLIMEDMAGAVARMRELDALGVRLAIDDFGTGYSSLSTLKRFPVSRLKIDRSFVADIPDDEDDMAITAAIVSLAQKLGLDVIAEGVETEAQAAFLLECGCDEIQGYLFSRPLEASAFASLLSGPRRAG